MQKTALKVAKMIFHVVGMRFATRFGNSWFRRYSLTKINRTIQTKDYAEINVFYNAIMNGEECASSRLVTNYPDQ